MSVNPNAYPGLNQYVPNAGTALSGSGFNGGAISGVGLSGYNAAPSGLGYYAQPAANLGGLGAYGNYAAQPQQAPAAGFQLDEQTVAEIETRLQYFVRRRQPVLRRQIIKVPGPAGKVQQVVRRLPTPQPDLIERVYVVKPQRDVVNLLIERPGTPPPQVQERRVVSRPHRPVINQQVVRVAPRTQVNQAAPLANYGYAPQPVNVNYGGYQPVAVAPVAQQYSNSYSASYDNLPAYGGYGNAAPAYGGYAYAAPVAPSYGGYANAASVAPAYGYQPYGADYSAGYGYPANGYGYQPSVVGQYYGQPGQGGSLVY